MRTQQFKEKFCQQYFYTVLTFVNRCSVTDDNFGFRFLCDALPQQSQNIVGWQLDDSDRVKEEDLMLGLEEFWMIADKHLRADRDLLIGILLGENCKLESVADVLVLRFIQELLVYFGGMQLSDLSEISSSLREYMKCLGLLNSLDASLFLDRTDRLHRYCAYIVFSLAGLTTLLRREWNNNVDGLMARKYVRPRLFEMPEQYVEVHIQLENPDIAESLHFMGEELNYTVLAKKYVPFNIDLSFGKEKFLKRGIHFTTMLTYYCWQTVVNVIIPKNYETIPLQVRLREKPFRTG